MAVQSFCPKCQTLLPPAMTGPCPRCANPIAPTFDPANSQPDTIDAPPYTQTFQRPMPISDAPLPAFENYDVLSELGRGGMGVVYKARQKRADRLVALKVMRDSQHVSEEEKMRFTAEVRALGRVSHPHIVAVFEVGEEGGCPFFTMEYIDGKPLSSRLHKGPPMTAAEAARLIEDLAGAVQAAHDVGVLHRDIKPGNILIDSHGAAKLTDFGLAKHLDQDTGLTAAGDALGTPSYMSPEQASGILEQIGPRADIYSLGATFYELLTGQPPFRAATPGGTLARVLQEEVLPPRKLRPELSPELEAVCLKCLEKKPEHRYPSARELAEDLCRWRNGEATKVRPWTLRRRFFRKARQHWKAIGATLFVLLTAGVFLFTFVWTSPEYQARQALLQVDGAMKSGERVVLIGATGPPKWSRKIVDAVDSKVSTDRAKVFQVSANSTTLIELAPAAYHDHYRISAELRARSSKSKISFSGIYFAHHRGDADAADFAERLLVIRHQRNLQDHDATSDFVNVVDGLRLSHEGVIELGQESPVGVHKYLINAGAMEEPWRYLDVEVTPQTIQARWRELDGSLHLIGTRNEVRKTVSPINVENLRKATVRRAKKLDSLNFPELPRRLEYQPRGAFGLYVVQAVVDFRNVVYEPLPMDDTP